MQHFTLRALALSVSLGVTALAQAAPIALSQPAQPLADALQSFARASGLKVHVIVAAWHWGAYMGDEALEKGIKDVVFDRGGFIYQGKIQALADAAREAGLNF